MISVPAIPRGNKERVGLKLSTFRIGGCQNYFISIFEGGTP
jgi:hypothetical protein